MGDNRVSDTMWHPRVTKLYMDNNEYMGSASLDFMVHKLIWIGGQNGNKQMYCE